MTNQPNDELPVADESVLSSETSSVVVTHRTIHRIVVALDASAHSRAAMNAAVTLAEKINAEVVGLFVEDINLLRMSELPFAREVLFAEAKLRRIERGDLQRKLQARAALLRHEIQDLAKEHNVSSTFRVIRGSVEKELLAAALDTDMLALGRLGHTIGRRARLGSTARTIVDRAASAVLLVKAGASGGPIVALYDGSDAGRRVLEQALVLAEHTDDLRVLVWAPTEIAAFENRQLAAHLLDASAAPIQYQHLSGDNPFLVLQWINRQKAGLLLLAGGETKLPPDIFETLLNEAEQHILVIR